jgi:dCMP deaminase
MRPDWDTYFMKIAEDAATRSTCDRALIGALLVKDRYIIATGYNGSPRGLEHCDEVGHLMVDGHCVRTVHAEQNAIVQAAVHGVVTVDTTCYVTHFPCLICTKLLINAGINRIVYNVDYRMDPIAVDMLKQVGVDILKLD